VTHFAGDDGKV